MKNQGDADSHAIRYRSDIDGLRAVAVLSVVAFHLMRDALPGGYLGVDMFFVLSGFLITSIVWRDARDERFTIGQFYNRRIRRIMPALLALLIVVTAAATLILLPADLIGYGKSLLSTLGFVANIYFWRDTDYFSRDATLKPLLHLWSLGVEEQFYLLYPLLLAFLAGRWSRSVLWVVGTITVGSFAANALALFVGGATPAFYLLPTRAWELGAGAMVALSMGWGPVGLAATVLSIVGASLVAFSLALPIEISAYSPSGTFIVLGTTLLLLAGNRALPIANRVLSFPPVVFVGLISYSLYLWHWPIIVFARYYLVRDLTWAECLGVVALAVALATISWRFVERPFRSLRIGIRSILWMAGATVLALGACGLFLVQMRGLPGRLNPRAARINEAVDSNYRCPVSDYLTLGLSRACVMNLPSRNVRDAEVILLGNSHAQMYAPAWTDILTSRGLNGLLVPLNQCLPTVSSNLDEACREAASRNLDAVLALPRVRTIIIASTWEFGAGALHDAHGVALSNHDNRDLIAAFDDLVRRLRAAGKRVILIGPLADPGWDVASDLGRELAFNRRETRPLFIPTASFRATYQPVFDHFRARSDVTFVRADTVQCGAARCEFLLDGQSLFADSNHVATAELRRFKPLFEKALLGSQ